MLLDMCHWYIPASSKERTVKRKYLIKCCGKNSCNNVELKKKPQLENQNASIKINGNFKTNRGQGTSETLLKVEIQKLSNPHEGGKPVTNVDDSALSEISTIPKNNMDSLSTKTDASVAINSDLSLPTSNQNLLPTKEPLAEETASTEKPISSDLTNIAPSSTTEALTKGDSLFIFDAFIILRINQIAASNTDEPISPISAMTSTTANENTKIPVSTSSTPSTTVQPSTLTATTSLSNTTKATTTMTKAYTTATTKAAQVNFESNINLVKLLNSLMFAKRFYQVAHHAARKMSLKSLLHFKIKVKITLFHSNR